MAGKGIIFGFWEGGAVVVVVVVVVAAVELREEGPICSFSLSMRPPLWHESDRIVKLAPIGMRSTSCRKSISDERCPEKNMIKVTNLIIKFKFQKN